MTLRYAHLAPSHKVKAVAEIDGEKPTIQKLYNRVNFEETEKCLTAVSL